MIETAIATYRLIDSNGRDIGELRAETVDRELVSGIFEPGSHYSEVEKVFNFFSDVVEQQSFSFLDQVDAQIAALGIHLADGTPIHDVQIYRDGNASFRMTASPERNGTH